MIVLVIILSTLCLVVSMFILSLLLRVSNSCQEIIDATQRIRSSQSEIERMIHALRGDQKLRGRDAAGQQAENEKLKQIGIVLRGLRTGNNR